MINHRGPEFAALQGDLLNRLKPVFGTSNDVIIMTASGTGALEAAVVNTLSPGDRVLAVPTGVFGDRFRTIAQTYGADVTTLTVAWGQAANPDDLRKILTSRGPFKAVLVTHNETSTGITNDLAAIGAAVRESDALLLVDAVSSLAAIPVDVDATGCDVVVSGSQKGLMTPPGLAFAAIGPRAWDAYQGARMPRFYWDFAQYKKTAERGQTPATPAITLYYALQAALDLLEAEGLSNVYARHHRLATKVRAGVRELGLELFANPEHASDTVTAVTAPAGLDVKRLQELLAKDGRILAGGQGTLSGKIFRIGHLGYLAESDVDGLLAALADALPRAQR